MANFFNALLSSVGFAYSFTQHKAYPRFNPSAQLQLFPTITKFIEFYWQIQDQSSEDKSDVDLQLCKQKSPSSRIYLYHHHKLDASRCFEKAPLDMFLTCPVGLVSKIHFLYLKKSDVGARKKYCCWKFSLF